MKCRYKVLGTVLILGIVGYVALHELTRFPDA